jgi:WD40 repeat protein
MSSLRRSFLCLCLLLLAFACHHRKPRTVILTPPSPDPTPAPLAQPGFAVSFSPDGVTAALVKGGVLSIFSLQGETPTKKDFPAVNLEEAQAISVTERWLVLGYSSGELHLYDRQTPAAPIKLLAKQSPIAVLSISADQRVLVAGYNSGGVTAFDLEKKSLLFSSVEKDEHAERVTALSVAPDGQVALSGGADKRVKLWSLNEGALLVNLTGHSRAVLSVALSPTVDYAISTSADGSARGWALPSGREVFFRLGQANVSAIRPDGARVVVVQPKGFALWEFSTGIELAQRFAEIPGPRAAVYQEATRALWVFTNEGELLRWALPAEVFPEVFSDS